ncbi:MAG: EAL domain-containing protein, partial [Nitrosomonadales bacterium]|nr:EAL domain-containing protein [Nitrosomonadales bacterium]
MFIFGGNRQYLQAGIRVVFEFSVIFCASIFLLGASLAFADTPYKLSEAVQSKVSKPHASLASIGLTATEREWLAAHPVITVGVRPGWMPIEFITEGRDFRGITIDYLSRLEELLGVTFEKVDYSENQAEEHADMLSGVLNNIVPEKTKYIALDNPYLVFPFAIYTNINNKSGISSLGDLANKRATVFKYGAVTKALMDDYPNIRLVKVELAEEAFAAIKSGSADAYIGNEMVVDYLSSIQGLRYVNKVGYTPYEAKVFMAVRTDWPELKSILEKSLAFIAPERTSILQNWDITIRQQYEEKLVIVLVIVFLIVSFVMYKVYQLKQAIKIQSKASQEKIWHQANFDFLTGLPNRMMFQDHLQQEMKNSDRSGLLSGLLFLDLDNFKEINDRLGHSAGDTLLIEVAQRISSCQRSVDTTARIGGDEFTVIMGGLGDIKALEVTCQKILAKLQEPFYFDDQVVYTGASIGITVYPDDTRNIEELLKFADQAMYEAKRRGRNRYQFFTASMQEASLKRLSIANDLRNALSNNEFVVYYQPIVDLKNTKITKAEALVRWLHPTKGVIGPNDFIHIAEDTGLINQLGDWVFRQVLKDLLTLRQSIQPDFQMSINISPKQFSEKSCLLAWMDEMRNMGLPGESVTLEITEGVLLEVSTPVKCILSEFRTFGMDISIDDFGTGYSALSYLKKFDIDFVKLDRTFVQNLELDTQDMVLCEAIINMAHKLGMKMIAEGIETQTQKELLHKFGCDFGQGFYFAK